MNTLLRKSRVLATLVFVNAVTITNQTSAATLKDWLGNIKNNAITPALNFLQMGCLLGGMVLIIFGAVKGYQKSRPQQGQQISVGEIVGSILVGIILVGIFAFANMASQTVTNNTTNIQSQW